ncbi:HepT-like ribonuclease domain-containing protein [Bradyrhizobium sp. USDA 3315]
MQPTVADRIGHIAAAIDSIRDITAGQTRESFASNLVMRLAVERLLEMISEAVAPCLSSDRRWLVLDHD